MEFRLSDVADLARENFPDIASNISKLTQDQEFQKILSQAGTIGGLINIGFAIFNKIRSKLSSEEQRIFVSFIQITFESAKHSIPPDLVDVPFKDIKSQIELSEIFASFLLHYSSNHAHLPDHPAVILFRTRVTKIMKEKGFDHSQIRQFIVGFNMRLMDDIKQSDELQPLLKSWKLKTTEQSLVKYLIYESSLLDEPNSIDDKAVSEYYVENKLVIIDPKSWEKSSEYISSFETEPWKIDCFLKGDKIREFIGAEFGTGKTNLAKKIAVDCAIDYLSGKDSYVPIYVPLKRNLQYIYNDEGLDQVVKLLKDQKILLICDGLDEYDGDYKSLIYSVLPDKLKDTDVKTIFTTRLDPDLPKKIDISGTPYVRLLPFTSEQVDEFFSRAKYNLPDINQQTLKEYGLDDNEISKPLFCWMFAIMYDSSGDALKIRNVSEPKIKRVLFFQEVIHSIIAGKHKDSQ